MCLKTYIFVKEVKLCDFNKSRTFCDSFDNQKNEIQSLQGDSLIFLDLLKLRNFIPRET